MSKRVMRADVAVVGGGAAGSICATLLARADYDVVLIEHTRVKAGWPELLSPEAALYLDRLGSPTSLLGECGVPCRGIIDTWNRPRAEFQDFQLTRCNVGWAVDRGRLSAALRRFAQQSGARLFCPSAPASLMEIDDSSVELSLPGIDQTVSASILVDGTGLASKLMPASWRRRLRFDRLIAIRVPLAVPLRTDDCMLFASSSAGWWYALDLKERPSFAVFVTDGDLYPRRSQAAVLHLRTQFQEAFADASRLEDALDRASVVTIRDARTTCRRRLWRGRWLPVGDAAFSLDPILGSGLVRCLEMAEEAAACIDAFLQTQSTEPLEHFAVQTSMVFAENLSRLHELYSVGREHHSVHPFWRRRTTFSALVTPI